MIKNFLIVLGLLAPQISKAAGITDIIDAGYSLITGVLIPLGFAICLMLFFWGVAKYLRSGAMGNDAAKEGRRIMIWGIVGLFIAFCIWGIVSLIRNELGIPGVDPILQRP